MSETLNKITTCRLGNTQRSWAAKIVGQYLAIRDCLVEATSDVGEIEDINEVAAQLTIAVATASAK